MVEGCWQQVQVEAILEVQALAMKRRMIVFDDGGGVGAVERSKATRIRYVSGLEM